MALWTFSQGKAEENIWNRMQQPQLLFEIVCSSYLKSTNNKSAHWANFIWVKVWGTCIISLNAFEDAIFMNNFSIFYTSKLNLRIVFVYIELEGVFGYPHDICNIMGDPHN